MPISQAETPLLEFARAAKAEHRIEECLQRSKSEAGLSDYEVRNWVGWHHHQTLSLIAAWFLNSETRREKKYTPAITLPQIRAGISALLHRWCQGGINRHFTHELERRLMRNESARHYHWKQCKRLAPLSLERRQIYDSRTRDVAWRAVDDMINAGAKKHRKEARQIEPMEMHIAKGTRHGMTANLLLEHPDYCQDPESAERHLE